MHELQVTQSILDTVLVYARQKGRKSPYAWLRRVFYAGTVIGASLSTSRAWILFDVQIVMEKMFTWNGAGRSSSGIRRWCEWARSG